MNNRNKYLDTIVVIIVFIVIQLIIMYTVKPSPKFVKIATKSTTQVATPSDIMPTKLNTETSIQDGLFKVLRVQTGFIYYRYNHITQEYMSGIYVPDSSLRKIR